MRMSQALLSLSEMLYCKSSPMIYPDLDWNAFAAADCRYLAVIGKLYMNNMFQWDFLSVHFIQYGQGYMEFEYTQKRIVHLVVV